MEQPRKPPCMFGEVWVEMEHIGSSSGSLLFSSSSDKFAYIMEGGRQGIFFLSSLKRIYHIQEDFASGPSA